MKPVCKKPKHWQLSPADRLSALPDSIVYRIISFLGFKEACRTSILSKRWKYISDTNPVMDLSNEVFSAVLDLGNWYNSMVNVDDFLKYTETRMKRYSKHKLLISKLTLGFPIRRMTFPNSKVLLENKAEKWVKIAVRNQVAELFLSGPKNYILSDSLFTAVSLRRLDCSYLEIHVIETFEAF
ncbi:putative FBD-associated F-box protein At5g56690 [Silene latifolia]|uniref:putative FBD-associated F-box protein At5g56690 n=1 Tax=Silene latifolia TaxID=37657 RepID=UPI003D78B185